MNDFYLFVELLKTLDIPTPTLDGYSSHKDVEEYCFKYAKLNKLKKPIKYEYALALAKLKMKECPDLMLSGSLALILAGAIPKRDVSDIDFTIQNTKLYNLKTERNSSRLDYNYNNYRCLTVINDLIDNDVYYNVFVHNKWSLRAQYIDGIKVQHIDDIIKYKKQFNRDKDKEDLGIL
jgi:hypothetical protein